MVSRSSIGGGRRGEPRGGERGGEGTRHMVSGNSRQRHRGSTALSTTSSSTPPPTPKLAHSTGS